MAEKRMKLSPTQRNLLASAMEYVDDQDELNAFFDGCVLDRNLRGLVRVGAIEKHGPHWSITTEALQALENHDG